MNRKRERKKKKSRGSFDAAFDEVSRILEVRIVEAVASLRRRRKKKAESGSKGSVQDRVLMRRPLLHRHEDLGQAVGHTGPPSFPCKPQPSFLFLFFFSFFFFFFLRFRGVSLKARPHRYRRCRDGKMAKGEPAWPTAWGTA